MNRGVISQTKDIAHAPGGAENLAAPAQPPLGCLRQEACGIVIWASPQLPTTILNISEALDFRIPEKFDSNVRGVRSGVDSLCTRRYRLGDGHASSVNILELVG
jgi:hypothetical protein